MRSKEDLVAVLRFQGKVLSTVFASEDSQMLYGAAGKSHIVFPWICAT